MRTLQEIYDASLARTSFTLVMLGIAGGMALLLGVAGDLRRHLLRGVAAHAGDRHPHRARRAGACSHRACSSAHGLSWPALGVATGLVAAFAIMRLMASLLFEVSPVDPFTYAVGVRWR